MNHLTARMRDDERSNIKSAFLKCYNIEKIFIVWHCNYLFIRKYEVLVTRLIMETIAN